MFKNYLKSSLRNLGKHKVYSFINIMGLAVGLCCCILIYLYVADEMSFDNFHGQEDSVFRVMTGFREDDGSIRERGPAVPVPVGPLMMEYFPEISDAVRFVGEDGTVRSDSMLANEGITFTDQAVFQVFSFPLIMGDAGSVLSADDSVVLTESLARKYFGDSNPLGRRLTITFGENRKDFIVSGVARNVPRNSTIKFRMLVNIRNLPSASYPEALINLGDFSYPLYIRFKDGASKERIEGRLDAFISQAFAAEFKKWRTQGFTKSNLNPIAFDLQRLREMHFDTRSFDGTDPSKALILAGIALIILVIASFNFVNLSIGRASVRATEVGMRKVIGASRGQLVFQFWGESLIMISAALVAGIALAAIFMPVFNTLSGKALFLGDFLKPVTLAGLVGLLFIVAAASGSYPALVMAGVQPVQVFRGRVGVGGSRGLPQVLVVVQFGLSVFLIITTILLGRQVRFMTEKETGFVKQGLVRVSLQTRTDDEAKVMIERFKAKAASYPGIVRVSAVNTAFGIGQSRFPIEKEGLKINVYQYRVDPDYVETLGLKIVEGRDFEKERVTDVDAVVVNQESCRRLGIENPVGRLVGEFLPGPSGEYPYKLRVIGILKDYNYLSFRQELQPVVLHMQPGWGLDNLLVRVRAAGVADTIGFLEKAWREVRPEKPFIYYFVEDDLESQYAVEKRWNAIIRYSSLFAVFIACMGIFGLTSLAVNRRFREIGIRKVFGAGVGQIFRLVTWEFLLLVAIANLAAWPAAFVVVRKVLAGYHYRITPGPQDFILAGAISLVVALATVSYLAVKAALSNPVKAIRYE